MHTTAFASTERLPYDCFLLTDALSSVKNAKTRRLYTIEFSTARASICEKLGWKSVLSLSIKREHTRKKAMMWLANKQ